MNTYGSEIGYQVRFDSLKKTNTRATFLTEGLLLRQFAVDPLLKQYNAIIMDEVHERHITGDFLLGVLKKVMECRQDLKLILMSATINAQLFSNYFNAPVIEIPGRMFPVTIEYHPIGEEDTNLTDPKFILERKMLSDVESIASRGTRINPG